MPVQPKSLKRFPKMNKIPFSVTISHRVPKKGLTHYRSGAIVQVVVNQDLLFRSRAKKLENPSSIQGSANVYPRIPPKCGLTRNS
jgi:hypothetical protein